ncbi:hypothetical protein A1O1_04879 [Capronia coronata CBS 617.96]|uniref:Uncharacterized protein n=1 Tax=Capronia coronata CBS 617.96 TaxID=1182541 RepID=W9Y566_9EURO|nr:uncharacterized protein A1O1_04879 [Capronia coronata CBS 617.96]EXJ87952.1 hypothetical protein A1O1_04879 [Capronia coronata CBS 617.96]
MIHPPPSSISLSESDVEFHLQQAQIYHGLLRQGFKRDDIIRYLADHRRAISEAAGISVDDELLLSSSTVELAYRRRQSSAQAESLQTGQESRTSKPPSSSESVKTSSRRPGRQSTELTESPEEDEDFELRQSDGRSVSPVSMVPAMQVNKHAPRKSSLLRFATAASQESPPADGVEGDGTPARIVTSRTPVEPDGSSELDEAYGHSSLPDWVVEEMRQISLDSTNAQRGSVSGLSDDMPFVLPEPLSATPRMQSLQSIGPARPTVREGFASASRRLSSSDSTLPIWTHHRSYTEGSVEDMPSSPPVFPASPVEESPPDDGPSTSSGLPATPTPIRRAIAFPRTEPRSHRHRYLDGNSFSVYNESLPATFQPQTPADLARGPYITEHDAAYTAPPGRIRVGSASAVNVEGQQWDLGEGEQSPTVRAIGLRERRNRELRRSVRAEGMRLRRMITREEALFTQHGIEAQQTGAGGGDITPARNPARVFQAMMDDMWRDDLEADRVGEENFEGDADINRRGVMRVVSGNARFEGWEGGPEPDR